LELRPFPPRGYPLGWVALVAAVGGVAGTLALRLDPMQNPDSIAFLALARSLLSGHGFRYQEPLIPGLDLFAFRAPGYPAFVALGLALGGVGTVIAIQGALHGLAAALVGGIARDLGAGRAAWIAFALRMIWPISWFYSGLLLNEIFYEFLTVLATWLVIRSVTRRQPSWAIPAGVCTAIAILCRPVGLGLAGALGLWLLLKHRRAVVPFALTALVVWAPWPIRNARVLHAFVPFTTNGGATAWAGTTDGQVRPAYDWMGAHVELGEIGFDRHFYALARERMRRDPGHLVAGALSRAFLYLGSIRGRAPQLWVHRFAMVAALAALGLGVVRQALLLPGLIWAAQGAMLVPLLLIDRYRFPTEWCVIVAAAFGIAGMSWRFGERRALVFCALALALCVASSLVLARG